MKLTCMIIDDEPLAKEVIERYIEQTEQLELIGAYNSVTDSYPALQSHPSQILFLDIEMPGLTGLELLAQMPDLPITILTTAHRDHALEAYDLGVIDYLVKPIRYERFIKAVNRATEFLQAKKLDIEFLENEKQTTISIKSGTKTILLPAESISHVQGLKDYSILFTEDKKFIVNGSIKTILEALPAEHFVRVHKSFIVAKKKVHCVQRNKIEFGEYQIPVGRVYKGNLNDLLRGLPN